MSKSQHSGGQASQRMLRVAELIRHAMSELLGRGMIDDPVLQSHPVTVIAVSMSPDLKLATVVVMPLGGKDTDLVMAALQRHRKFLRGEVTRRIEMRFSPELRFIADKIVSRKRTLQLLKSGHGVRPIDAKADGVFRAFAAQASPVSPSKAP